MLPEPAQVRVDSNLSETGGRAGRTPVTLISLVQRTHQWPVAFLELTPGQAGRACDVDRVVNLDDIVVGVGCSRQKGDEVSSSLTTLIILITLLHVAAFVVMVMIRVWRNEADGVTGESAKITPCVVCREPATHLGYDGLDPGEQRDPYTGRAYSTDMAHYQPLCAAH